MDEKLMIGKCYTLIPGEYYIHSILHFKVIDINDKAKTLKCICLIDDDTMFHRNMISIGIKELPMYDKSYHAAGGMHITNVYIQISEDKFASLFEKYMNDIKSIYDNSYDLIKNNNK